LFIDKVSKLLFSSYFKTSLINPLIVTISFGLYNFLSSKTKFLIVFIGKLPFEIPEINEISLSFSTIKNSLYEIFFIVVNPFSFVFVFSSTKSNFIFVCFATS
jgi:hypothetical protein